MKKASHAQKYPRKVLSAETPSALPGNLGNQFAFSLPQGHMR